MSTTIRQDANHLRKSVHSNHGSLDFKCAIFASNEIAKLFDDREYGRSEYNQLIDEFDMEKIDGTSWPWRPFLYATFFALKGKNFIGGPKYLPDAAAIVWLWDNRSRSKKEIAFIQGLLKKWMKHHKNSEYQELLKWRVPILDHAKSYNDMIAVDASEKLRVGTSQLLTPSELCNEFCAVIKQEAEQRIERLKKCRSSEREPEFTIIGRKKIFCLRELPIEIAMMELTKTFSTDEASAFDKEVSRYILLKIGSGDDG